MPLKCIKDATSSLKTTIFKYWVTTSVNRSKFQDDFWCLASMWDSQRAVMSLTTIREVSEQQSLGFVFKSHWGRWFLTKASYKRPVFVYAFIYLPCWHCVFDCTANCKLSGLYRSGGVGLGESGGGEADPDVPGVKTLKNPVHNNIWEICKTELRLYTVCQQGCLLMLLLFKGFLIQKQHKTTKYRVSSCFLSTETVCCFLPDVQSER